MCGIVGQLRSSGHPVDQELIARMCAALEHRGPDSRGVHHDHGIGLGVQRLRVLDLNTGDQPIYNEDRSVVVVMNGEIYNYRELRRDLGARGHRFATQGDAEVLVHLYEEHGVECVTRAHGMFAFALWDTRRRQLLLARDRVGKKPLLYSARDGVLSFASEMGALLEDETIPRRADRLALDRFLAFGYVPTPLSAISDVHKLPPAHVLVAHDGRIELKRYWTLDYGHKLDAPVEEISERIRETLRAATRRRLAADVPVGVFLSGGIDSSAIVAAMAEASPGQVRTFAIGFDDASVDERRYARQIAQRFGTEHEEFQVRADAVEMLPRIVRHHGEPFADSTAIPSFYLAEMTRRHVTVALNGDGGDELFGGYARYTANVVAGRLDRLPYAFRQALELLATRIPERGGISSPRNRFRRLAGTLAADPHARYARYVAWIAREQRNALYTSEFTASLADTAPAEELIHERWAAASGQQALDRILEIDAGTYLVDDLLAKMDIATMAYGLEARSPFLDHEMMELAASIPAELKIRGTEKKWILRSALRGWVPDEILDRPKQGFVVPLDAWLRGDLRSLAHEVLLDPATLARGFFRRASLERLLARHAAGTEGEANRIWALMMFELWHREFIDAPQS
jgi:asparagine synthase (glutamine-hydrolysing)